MNSSLILTKIYFFIRDHPCCRRGDIAKRLHYSLGYVDVNLRTLKQAGLIIHKSGYKVAL